MKLTQITNPLALRRDTTVGTRIFAGNTMIYGDTGFRDVREWLTPYLTFEKNFRWANVKRNGSTVTLEVQADTGENEVEILTEDLPVGFRPPQRYGRALGVVNVGDGGSIVPVHNNNKPTRLALYPPLPTNTRIAFNITWETRDPWPTTLPGLPA